MTPLTQTKLLSFKDNFKSLVNLSLRGSLPNKLIFSGVANFNFDDINEFYQQYQIS